MDEIQDLQPQDAPAPDTTAWRSWVGAGAIAAAILVGGIVLLGGGDNSTADARSTATGDTATADDDATPAGGAFLGRGTGGDITAIDGGTITLDADGESITVVTSADTSVTETVEGSVSDIAVGDTVLVAGEVVDGAVTADSIAEGAGGLGGGFRPAGGGSTPPDGFEPPDGAELPEGFDPENPPGGFEPPDGAEIPDGGRPGGDGPGGFVGFTNGEVTAIDGSTLTVTADDGTIVSVTADDETTITTTVELEVRDLEVGDTIRVVGETTDSTVEAQAITVGPLGGIGGGGFGGPPPGAGATEDEG